jgi:hypothetical protein
MRLARVKKRAIPPLRMALEGGDITLYRAAEIARLPAREQAAAVAQWTVRFLRRTEGQRIAATVIREELANPEIDLDGILSAIREAVAR